MGNLGILAAFSSTHKALCFLCMSTLARGKDFSIATLWIERMQKVPLVQCCFEQILQEIHREATTRAACAAPVAVWWCPRDPALWGWCLSGCDQLSACSRQWPPSWELACQCFNCQHFNILEIPPVLSSVKQVRSPAAICRRSQMLK